MSSQRLTDYIALGTSGDRPVSLDLATGCAGFRWETDTGAWAWDGADWVNFAGILPGSPALAGLSDVDLTGPSTNDLLKFDGDFWVDLSLTEILDQLIGTDQGSIITRGASAWEGLPPGTEGQVLTAHGADDLTWEDAPGSGGLITFSKTADYTILTGEDHSRFNNIGASANIVLTLPAAADGLQYGFAVFEAHYLKIQADGTDEISDGETTSAAGGFIRSNAPYSFLQIEAHGSGRWIVSSEVGTWGVDV